VFRAASVPFIALFCFALFKGDLRLAAQSATRRAPAGSNAPQPISQAELNARIQAANAAQTAGDPGAVADADKHLLATALAMMAQLRSAEGAYPQATELYQSSLAFADVPAVRADLALSAGFAGQPDITIAQAQALLRNDSKNAQLYMTLGRAYIAKQDYLRGAEALARATQLHPDIDALYSLAVCWLEAKTPDSRQRADAAFAQMKALAGDSGSLHVLIGRAYRDAGLRQDALAEFKRAIAIDPTTPHAHYFLGLAYLSLNEWKPTPEAQVELQKEVQYHPEDFLVNYMIGFLMSSQRDYGGAEKYLRAAIAIDPSWPEPYLYLGLNAYAQGDPKAAELLLRKAVELTGSDEARSNYQIRRAYVDLGRILAASGRDKESDVFFAKARALENKTMVDSQQRTTAMLMGEGAEAGMAAVVPLDKQQEQQAAPLSNPAADPFAPPDAAALAKSTLTPAQRDAATAEEAALRPVIGQAFSDLATSEAIQHNYTAALLHYQQAEIWNPAISGLDKNLGLAAFRAGDYPEAIHGLSRVLAEQPDAAPVRAVLGMAYFYTQKYGDAANTFFPLGQLAMHDPTVGYAWAASVARTGDLKDATQVLSIYQQGATLTPDALLLVGQLWIEIGDYDKAISTLRQALAANPSLPKAHYFIAMADIHAERLEDARKEFNAELALTPDDPDANYNLGFIDLQQSKLDAAAAIFQRVVAAHPDYANAQYQLGKILLDRGEVQAAIPHLQAAVKFAPDKDYVHYQLQAAYRKESRTADADRELALYEQLKTRARPHIVGGPAGNP
jgi:tetratricopeptide (TPR) repeat protein